MGRILDKGNRFKTGKHKDKKLAQVAEEEPSYIRWLLQDSCLPFEEKEKRKLQQHLAPEIDGRASYLPEGYYRKTGGQK